MSYTALALLVELLMRSTSASFLKSFNFKSYKIALDLRAMSKYSAQCLPGRKNDNLEVLDEIEGIEQWKSMYLVLTPLYHPPLPPLKEACKQLARGIHCNL